MYICNNLSKLNNHIKKHESTGHWEQYENLDRDGSDMEIIYNWRQNYTIEGLKRLVEKRGYSAFKINKNTHEAWLKKFSSGIKKSE